jgi:quinohemoprotein ethanol dehydrogenase
MAYAADTGKVLWTYDARSPVVAPPITYELAGRQYVTVLTGSGGAGGGAFAAGISGFGIDYYSMPRRVLTFSLDAKATLPPAPPPLKLQAPEDPTYRPDETLASRGNLQYHKTCTSCHGMGAVSAGTAPDLRASRIPLQQTAFQTIVRQGTLVSAGMPQFAELAEADVEAIRQYLRSLAQALPKGTGH